MLDFFVEAPRFAFCTIAGVVVGVVGVLLLRHFNPLASPMLGAAVLAGGLVIGMAVGAIWEVRRS
jgi:hypothetical protein